MLSDPLYARSTADLALRLPTGEEEDDAIPSFAIAITSVTQSTGMLSNTFANIENVLATKGSDTVTGSAANNLLEGADGDDRLEGAEGNDTLDDGDGSDTAVFSGDQAHYTLVLAQDAATLTDRRSDGNGTDQLISIEALDFDVDTFGAPFDLASFDGLTRLSQTDLNTFVELYIAYFNRAPDAIGLSFWGTSFANGVSLEEMASLFVDQDETRATYPSDLTNSDFATSIYNNVLGRIPDQLGFDFWVDALNSGNVGRDQFIFTILGGAKAPPPNDAPPDFVAQQVADQQYLATKTDIGVYFAVTNGMSDLENASAVMTLFNGSSESAAAALAATDGYYADALATEGGEFILQVVGLADTAIA